MPVAQIAEQPLIGLFDAGVGGLASSALIVVDLDPPATSEDALRALRRLAATRAMVVAVSVRDQPRGPIAALADLCIAPKATHRSTVAVDDPYAAVAELEGAVAANPVAALTVTWVLRASETLPVADALTLESTAYSTLLAGSEFRTWLHKRGAPRPSDGDQRVRVSRSGDTLHITLDRPARVNAVDALMRDSLAEALLVAELDPTVRVVLSGAGPSFSAGGDLDEFGSSTDVAAAHVLRVATSVGAAIHRVADRVTARVQGSCLGAGIELPAFAGRLIAAPGAQFGLPEVSMGLIPGAGGTVSVPRRIGRWRTLWLALTATHLPAQTALEWGLVDAIE